MNYLTRKFNQEMDLVSNNLGISEFDIKGRLAITICYQFLGQDHFAR